MRCHSCAGSGRLYFVVIHVGSTMLIISIYAYRSREVLVTENLTCSILKLLKYVKILEPEKPFCVQSFQKCF